MAHSERLQELVREWRERAQTLRTYGAESSAAALEACVAELETALREVDDGTLTLAEAAEESGYSVDHLSRLLREGKIQNAGRRGAPRIAARDLPRRSGLEPRPRRAHLSRAQIVRSAIKKGA